MFGDDKPRGLRVSQAETISRAINWPVLPHCCVHRVYVQYDDRRSPLRGRQLRTYPMEHRTERRPRWGTRLGAQVQARAVEPQEATLRSMQRRHWWHVAQWVLCREGHNASFPVLALIGRSTSVPLRTASIKQDGHSPFLEWKSHDCILLIGELRRNEGL